MRKPKPTPEELLEDALDALPHPRVRQTQNNTRNVIAHMDKAVAELVKEQAGRRGLSMQKYATWAVLAFTAYDGGFELDELVKGENLRAGSKPWNITGLN